MKKLLAIHKRDLLITSRVFITFYALLFGFLLLNKMMNFSIFHFSNSFSKQDFLSLLIITLISNMIFFLPTAILANIKFKSMRNPQDTSFINTLSISRAAQIRNIYISYALIMVINALVPFSILLAIVYNADSAKIPEIAMTALISLTITNTFYSFFITNIMSRKYGKFALLFSSLIFLVISIFHIAFMPMKIATKMSKTPTEFIIFIAINIIVITSSYIISQRNFTKMDL